MAIKILRPNFDIESMNFFKMPYEGYFYTKINEEIMDGNSTYIYTDLNAGNTYVERWIRFGFTKPNLVNENVIINKITVKFYYQCDREGDLICVLRVTAISGTKSTVARYVNNFFTENRWTLFTIDFPHIGGLPITYSDLNNLELEIFAGEYNEDLWIELGGEAHPPPGSGVLL